MRPEIEIELNFDRSATVRGSFSIIVRKSIEALLMPSDREPALRLTDNIRRPTAQVNGGSQLGAQTLEGTQLESSDALNDLSSLPVAVRGEAPTLTRSITVSLQPAPVALAGLEGLASADSGLQRSESATTALHHILSSYDMSQAPQETTSMRAQILASFIFCAIHRFLCTC